MPLSLPPEASTVVVTDLEYLCNHTQQIAAIDFFTDLPFSFTGVLLLSRSKPACGAARVVRIVLPANETRFMVMAPGGENPRPDLDPATRKLGVRVHRRSRAMQPILELRERLTKFETEYGRRLPMRFSLTTALLGPLLREGSINLRAFCQAYSTNPGAAIRRLLHPHFDG